MQPQDTDRRVDRICAFLGALGLWTLGVLINLFSGEAAREGGLPSAGWAPALAPEFDAHLLGINLWLGLTVGLLLAQVLGERVTIPEGVRLGMDLFGAYTVGRIALGGAICVTPGATVVARVLLMAVLFVLLLSASERLASLLRGRDPLAARRESDAHAG